MARLTPVVIMGLPRSGTTWTAEVLAAGDDVRYVHEPDNFGVSVVAAGLRRGRIEPPWLQPGDHDPAYERLWRLAVTGRGLTPRQERAFRARAWAWRPLRGLRHPTARLAARALALRRPAAGRVVVKSVACYLSAEWVERTTGAEVVVVHRHPINLATGWRSLGWESSAWSVRGPFEERFAGTAAWPAPDGGLERTTWEACASQVLLLEAAARNPTWHVVGHEARCLAPERSFRELLDDLGFEWEDAHDRALAGLSVDRGSFTTGRNATEEAGRWRTRIADGRELDAAVGQIRRFSESSAVAAPWAELP